MDRGNYNFGFIYPDGETEVLDAGIGQIDIIRVKVFI